MSFQVLVDTALPEAITSKLGACDIHLWPADLDAAQPLLDTIEGLFTYGHPHVDGALLDRMPHLRVISNFGVGVDHIDLQAAKERGIPVGNTPNLVDGATADLTFALVLVVARNLVQGVQHAHGPAFTSYNPNILLGSDVHGATLGIIGMGNIGRQVAKRAKGFGMNVLYHNRRPQPEAEAETGATYVGLHDLLRQADFVTLNVPLSNETRGMIGREELRMMRPTAFLINAARGGVVDHEALVEALSERWIAGAALDVTEPEPLPRDHPLLKLDNVIITPHLGSATRQTRQAMGDLAVENLLAGLQGQPLVRRCA